MPTNSANQNQAESATVFTKAPLNSLAISSSFEQIQGLGQCPDGLHSNGDFSFATNEHTIIIQK